MEEIYKRPDFELYAERKVTGEVVSVSVYSVWPLARTDRSPHRIFNINLPKEAADKLADVFKGV